MKRIAALVVASLLLLGWTRGTGVFGAAAWQPFRLGAGGQITGLRSYSDGTMLARTDTMGGYLYVPSGSCTYGGATYSGPCWQQLVTPTSVASFSIDQANGDGGVREIVAAPSNTNVLYMLWNLQFWVSTNKGSSWTLISGVANTNSANDGNASGPWIAVDPNTASTVFVATTSGVSKVTTATTSPSVASVASIPGAAALAFEQGSSTHVLAAVKGGSVYESTNGSTFAVTTGTPTVTDPQLHADKFSQFWLAEANGSTTNLFKYASSTWSTKATLESSEAAAVITNPASSAVGSNQVVVTNYKGQLSVSNDNGGTWTGPSGNVTFSASGSQPAWLGNAFQATPSQLNGYSIAMDSSQNLWFAGGIGVWEAANPVNFGTTAYAANTLGVEQLVDIEILTPPGGSPLANVWDRGFFTQHNPDSFPSTYYLNSSATGTPIMFGWSIDYASSDGTFVAGWQNDLNATARGALSTDGGNTFSAWTNQPPSSSTLGGWIGSLTSQKWAMVSFVAGGNQPIYYTTNGASTAWNTSTIAGGNPNNWMSRGVGVPLAADRIAADTYCAINQGRTVYYSTNAGANFSLSGVTSATIDGSPNASMLRASNISSNGASVYFFTAGGQSGPHPASTHLWKLTKTTNPCDTATSVGGGNLLEVIAFGFGATKPGASNQTIYAYGWLNSALQFVQSTDGGTTWTAINVPSNQLTWPLNSADLVVWVDGDPDIYGRINVGFRGSGGAYIDTNDSCPWVNWTSTNPNASLTGTVTLTAAHSGLVPVTGVNFYADGVQIGSTQTGQTTYSVSWNTGGVATGAHTLKVQAQGNNCGFGGAGNSKSIPVTTH